MANKLLDFVAGTGDKAGNWYFNNLGEACIYALLGFLIVFAGIVLLILIVWLIGLIMRKTDNLAFMSGWGKAIKAFFSAIFGSKKKKEQPSVESLQESVVDDGDIPDEVKVAIMAAIMSYYSEQQPECEFKVKRIKRI